MLNERSKPNSNETPEYSHKSGRQCGCLMKWMRFVWKMVRICVSLRALARSGRLKNDWRARNENIQTNKIDLPIKSTYQQNPLINKMRLLLKLLWITYNKVEPYPAIYWPRCLFTRASWTLQTQLYTQNVLISNERNWLNNWLWSKTVVVTANRQHTDALYVSADETNRLTVFHVKNIDYTKREAHWADALYHIKRERRYIKRPWGNFTFSALYAIHWITTFRR